MKKLLMILYLLCSIAMQAKEINENKIHKKGAKTDGNRKEKHLNKQQLQWGVWDAIVDFADWLTSPFRPVWGDYEEDNMRKEGPYYLFDRKLDGPTYVQIQM